MIALRGPSTWRVFIIHVFTWAFADASDKTWVIGDTPLFFLHKSSAVKRTVRKNLRFPRHFFVPRGKYAVEDMEDSIYEKYGIDPNRIPTDAEVELVAYCFDVDQQEAISILRTRDLKTSARFASDVYGVNFEAS